MKKMSTEELRIAERARKFSNEPLTNLNQFITTGLLHKKFRELNKYSSRGTDGENWFDYALEAKERIPELLSKYKTGKYKAPPIRRVYIPKGKTGKRPLGIPTIEDKVLQSGIRTVIEPVYEELFKDSSYGFRPNRSCHQAIENMFHKMSFGNMRYIIDADIQDYFGSINHGLLREFLDQRVKDGVIRRMLDKWFSEVIQPRLKGKSFIVRYADDFVLGFKYAEDANRVMEVLPKRFGKYSLRLHPEKTRIVNLNKSDKGNRSFDFLGFTHYMGRSRKGKPILKRKTSKKKFTYALNNLGYWIKRNRHAKLTEIILELNAKLRGHYNYYGITFNSISIANFYHMVKALLYKWLNRRGGKPKWHWARFTKLVNQWLPLLKPKIYHSCLLAKPN